jgi:hypothetical protein
MIVNPKIQEINIPGIRKLRGGDVLSIPVIKRLKATKQYEGLVKNKTIVDSGTVLKTTSVAPTVTATGSKNK